MAEGIVYSTKPLSYQGQLIENFSIRFEGGKAVEVHAEKNEALLQKLISMDEGASYLGECALVPYNSPIQNSGLLFYNTLFDENAACHLALGMGFADTIKNFENYTLDECRAKGINDSMVHEDCAPPPTGPSPRTRATAAPCRSSATATGHFNGDL